MGIAFEKKRFNEYPDAIIATTRPIRIPPKMLPFLTRLISWDFLQTQTALSVRAAESHFESDAH